VERLGLWTFSEDGPGQLNLVADIDDDDDDD